MGHQVKGMGPGHDTGRTTVTEPECHELRKYGSLDVFSSLMSIYMRVSSHQLGLIATAWIVHDGWQTLWLLLGDSRYPGHKRQNFK